MLPLLPGQREPTRLTLTETFGGCRATYKVHHHGFLERLGCWFHAAAPHLCLLPEGIGLNGGGEEEEEGAPLTTHPSTTVSFTDTSWDQMAKVMPWPAQRSEVGGGGVTEIFLPGDHNEAQQVRSFEGTRGRSLSLPSPALWDVGWKWEPARTWGGRDLWFSWNQPPPRDDEVHGQGGRGSRGQFMVSGGCSVWNRPLIRVLV